MPRAPRNAAIATSPRSSRILFLEVRGTDSSEFEEELLMHGTHTHTDTGC